MSVTLDGTFGVEIAAGRALYITGGERRRFVSGTAVVRNNGEDQTA